MSELPTREEMIRMIEDDSPEIKNSDQIETLIFGLAGGCGLEATDPLFLEAVNATLGFQSGTITTTIPVNIPGHALLTESGELIGFTCLTSDLEKK